MLLALDTATRQAGLALYDGEGLRAEVTWNATLHHTQWLAPAIAEALGRLGASAADLVAVGVTVGPGSFTGLRVALSLAKGIAAARNLPLLGVRSLDVVAYPHVGQGQPVCATVVAGRGRHGYAIYPRDTPRAAPAAPEPQLADLRGLAAAIASYEGDGPVRVVGEFTAAERAALAEQAGGQADLAPPALAARRPGALAELAWHRFQAGQRDDLATLEPLYLLAPVSGG